MKILLILLALPLTVFANPGFAGEHISVAIFQGDGVGRSVQSLITALEESGKSEKQEFRIRRISADDIRGGQLADVGVLIHPGGSGSKQGKALGEQGRKTVRAFVKNGGGYLGVCAGAYLATNDYSWSLKLIDAKVVDRLHWARGTGSVTLRLSSSGAGFFRKDKPEIKIHYGQGPLLARREWDDIAVPDYESLAIYNSEIATKGAPRGIMKGTSAIVRAKFGKGRVFCFSPHPELTDGLHGMIPLAAHWLASP